MNTEQIMALVDAYAAALEDHDNESCSYGEASPEAIEEVDIARTKVIDAIEALQNRDDWK